MINKECIVWQGKYYNTTELVTIIPGKINTVKSHIIGEANGTPLDIQYELKISNAWVIQSVLINVLSGDPFTISLEKDFEGNWHNGNGKIIPGFNLCIDIDISVTPFTNTLPINRLKIPAGHSQKIEVLYFNLPEIEFKPTKQQYTNLGNGYYKYENLESGFTSVIRVNDEGFVIDYPGIWQMVYPVNVVPPSKANFISALISDEPSADIEENERVYDQLIGSWDVKAIDYLEDGLKLEQDGEWIFSRVLEGRAVQDIFIVPKRSQRTTEMPKPYNRYGFTLRMYDYNSRKWNIYWSNPLSGIHNHLSGTWVGKDIVQTGKDAKGNLMRWSLREIKPESFHWLGEISDDEGKNWKLSAEFFCTRKK